MHDAALFQVTDGAAADVRLGHLVHLDGAHDAGVDADLFQRVLHGQRIDDRGQHAHVVGGDAVHLLGSGGYPAKNIAAADHQSDLDAGGGDRRRFRRPAP